ncbi:MAG: nucleoside triphosphate pyrophosphohydrolase [Chloroflexaceae bacterium]|nr:nucleoside triphosphate pyrophosphohydrolase [Chloroflexaceae bacterium]
MSEETVQQPYHCILQALQHLIAVVARLRSPQDGCAWDLAQTPQTLIPYVIEEAYEVVDAIRGGDSQKIAEELGDLLLQVVLQAQIASEVGSFDLQDVARSIADKLIRRHPHIFADAPALNTPEEVRQQWDAIKATEAGETAEKRQLSQKLAQYIRTFPPLLASVKISQKAAVAGFEWENAQGVWDKFHEELEEFKTALATEAKPQQQAELGDLLFTLVNIARWYDLDCSDAIHGTNERFIKRLGKIEAIAKGPLSDYSLDELQILWQQAKAQLLLEDAEPV